MLLISIGDFRSFSRSGQVPFLVPFYNDSVKCVKRVPHITLSISSSWWSSVLNFIFLYYWFRIILLPSIHAFIFLLLRSVLKLNRGLTAKTAWNGLLRYRWYIRYLGILLVQCAPLSNFAPFEIMFEDCCPYSLQIKIVEQLQSLWSNKPSTDRLLTSEQSDAEWILLMILAMVTADASNVKQWLKPQIISSIEAILHLSDKSTCYRKS